jgi:hypothetical protein
VVKAEFTVRSGADMVERNLTELVSLQLKN